MALFVPVGLALLGLANAQTPVGTEVHPQLTTYRCTVAGGCTEATNYVVLDSLAHWVHQVNSTVGCGDWGNAPNATACPTEEACAANCIQEAQTDYSTVGVTTDGASLRMQMIVNNASVSPRIYLLDETEEKYEMTKFTGAEFSFDIDATALPCGMNSALYLSEMEDDGGLSELNQGGAARGTGYCDAQCYTTPFINGVGNLDGAGACCNEMDIWEANARATQIAPHPCNESGVYLCSGTECASEGVCDKNGCGWNTYRLDQADYYGEGSEFDVDTTKPFTVVTQFPVDETTGKLAAINRLYVQDGVVLKAETVAKEGLPAVDSITDEYCTASGASAFDRLGALEAMGDAMTRGMVMAFSIWWSTDGSMVWLDGASQGAGPCTDSEDLPENILAVEPEPEVTFSNLKWGEIGSTFAAATNATSRIRFARNLTKRHW
ncbi:Endoglucanase EG-1 [Pestalotiopsis fici W106-1]|uniref:Glucanase n=1 Tax=Pestalotiopsis fici (strain W106-1 / CGMCC3.15140) TaxID=1229662 RepID=W3XJI0_PESFW|nr:Endoglucanase EG-1 [Pestalotiopsis fici W106-1]ETS86175.1 Endoglucanase EG-1 [Pestalotiopsis fici W106-1]